MNLLQFMDKHIFFSFFVVLILVTAIDNMWANWCSQRAATRHKKQRKKRKEDHAAE